MKPGVKIQEIVVGEGPEASRNSTVTVVITAFLNRGEQISEPEESRFSLSDRSETIAGVLYGVVGMRVGGKRRIRVSPHLAFGERGADKVPPNAVLIFEVELKAVD